jgi:hypothetical protein
MEPDRASSSPPAADPSQKVAPFKRRLTREQLECLSRCARGISVRFERPEIIDALVEAGYAEKGLAGVVTVTAEGREYVRAHAS